MGSVIVLSEEAVQELTDPMLVSLAINGSGQLTMTKKDGTVSTVGYVRDHSELLNLDADDHPHYALADGTRGDFATEAQGTKADAARVNTATEIDLDAGDTTDGYLEDVTVIDDGSSTAGWINRWVWRFLSGGVLRLVTFLNEYGELRGIPAKLNTTWLRMFLKDSPTTPVGTRDADVPIAQLMDDRTNRTPIWGLYPNGNVRIGEEEIEMSYVLVLGDSDPIPTGTPAGTVIVREAP